jgi:hypothetical protein
MKITVDDELVALCTAIQREDRTPSEWAAIESDDSLQSAHYEGGFDSIEMAFTFSFFDADDRELWFQLTLDEVYAIAQRRRQVIDARPAREA